MILAKEQYDHRSWEVQNEVTKKTVRKVVNKKKQQKVQTGYLLIVAIAFLLGVIIAARYTQVSVAGYGLNKINTELALLQKENQQLNVELSHLKSLDRIEKIATTKLGMVPPENVQFIALEGKGAAAAHSVNEQQSEAKTSQVNEGKVNKRSGFLGAIASIFEGTAIAEAGTGH